MSLRPVLLTLFALISTGALAALVVVDDSDPGFSVLTGSSFAVVDQEGQWGTTSRRANTDSAFTEVQWEATLPDGDYEVLIWYPSLGDLSTSGAWYKIFHADGQRNRFINQWRDGSQWVSLGTYRFEEAQPARVTLINQAAAGKKIFADAVFFRGATQPPVTPPTPVEVVPGVFHSEWILPTPLVVNVLEFDLASPELDLELAFPEGRRNFSTRWRTSQIAQFADTPDHEVIGAINSGFFFSGIGIHGLMGNGSNVIAMPTPDVIQETYVLQESGEGWGGFRVPEAEATVEFSDGQVRPIGVLNNVCESNTRALYTSDWDTSTRSTTQGVEVIIEDVNLPLRFNKEMVGTITAVRTGASSLNNTIPSDGFVLAACSGTVSDLLARAEVGEEVTIRFDQSPLDLTNARVISNGSGWLVREGAPFQSTGNVRHPRTIICWTGTRHWFVTIDGRQSGYSVGASVAEMVDFITSALGAENAINFDGGGSTAMVVEGVVVNSPSDGSERAVGNALLLVQRALSPTDSLRDEFDSSGPALPWDEKFAHGVTVTPSHEPPSGDEFALRLRNLNGGFETASLGSRGDEDYAVEAWVLCDNRLGDSADGFERVGIFARDDGNANFDSEALGGGNCYAMIFDSDTGLVRPVRFIDGEMFDFREGSPFAFASDGWRHFRIECRGDHIRFVLNGEVFADVLDTAHSHGRAGLAHSEHFATEGLELGGHFDSFALEPWPEGAFDLSGQLLH